MPLYINHTEITDEQVFAEMQYHPASSLSEAQEKAAQALAIRELLLQEAARLGITAPDASATQEAQEDFLISRLLEQEEDAPGVDREHAIVGLLGALGRRHGPEDSGVGDYDVDAAKLGRGLLEQPADVGDVGGVPLFGQRLTAARLDRGDRLLGLLVVLGIVDDHRGAVAGQPLGDGASDAAGAARYDCDLAG